MKKIEFLSLVSTAVVGLALPALAGPRGGGVGFGGGGFAGGGHSGGGGRVGGFAGGGSHAPTFYGGSFRATPYGGGFRAAPVFRSNGAYFTGRSVGGLSRAPRFYYGGTRMAGVRPRGFTAATSRPTRPYVARLNVANRQPNRVASIAGRSRFSDPRTSTAANRQSFLRNHAFARHDSNWHRDWDRHHAHFHNGNVFVFIDGSWWGLYPWDYSPYSSDYGYSPYDYSYGYPDDYSANPYDYYNYYPYNDDDQPANATSDPYGNNATVSAVQFQLENLGYYNGSIDGTLGDQTEAAIAR